MKFGKQIQTQALPEWASHYMNYKALKKIIKAQEARRASPRTVGAAGDAGAAGEGGRATGTGKDDEQPFLNYVDREVEKVEAFYNQREEELKLRLASLVEKKAAMLSKPRRRADVLQTFREAFQMFQQEVNKLQNFAELNNTGLRKILKKYDRRVTAAIKEVYLASHADVKSIANKPVLAELADKASAHLAELDQVLRDLAEDKGVFDGWMNHSDVLEQDLLTAVSEDNANQMSAILDKLHLQDVEAAGAAAASSVAASQESLQHAFRRACRQGRLQAVRLLLSRGVDVAGVNDVSGRTCLHEAAIGAHLQLLQLLVERGADVNAEDMHGRRPLHYVAMTPAVDAARFLLASGAVLVCLDQDGLTPLLYAIRGGHAGTLAVLLDRAQPTDAFVDVLGRSHLAVACEYGHASVVQLLVERGANVNTTDGLGLTALHMCSREGHADCVRILTDHGADVNIADKEQCSALAYAAMEGHSDCVRLLLAAGSRPDMVDESNWTPWQHALFAGHMETADLLRLPRATAAVASVQTTEAAERAHGEAMELLSDDPMPVLDLDAIPSLSLPPPIIPTRTMGHSYLENRIHLQLKLGIAGVVPPIRLVDPRRPVALKLTISSKPDVGMPHTIDLPLQDAQESFAFVTEAIESLSLQFDLRQAFGSKITGRGIAPPSVFETRHGPSTVAGASSGTMRVPILNTYLDVVAEVAAEFIIVRPFVHPGVASTNVQMYWKQTTTIADGGSTAQRKDGRGGLLVTGSSLVQEYTILPVQLTRDLVPVVSASSTVTLGEVAVPVHALTLAQLRHVARYDSRQMSEEPSPSRRRVASDLTTGADLPVALPPYPALQEVLTSGWPSLGLCLELTGADAPDAPAAEESFVRPDVNAQVDAILRVVYQHGAGRSIMFCSASPQLCLTTNLKQPNFPVIFRTYAGRRRSATDARCNSIQQGVRFAKAANLLGVLCEATPLVEVPALVHTIKKEGLILATFGDANLDQGNLQLQEAQGVDAVVVNGRLRVKNSLSWL